MDGISEAITLLASGGDQRSLRTNIPTNLAMVARYFTELGSSTREERAQKIPAWVFDLFIHKPIDILSGGHGQYCTCRTCYELGDDG